LVGLGVLFGTVLAPLEGGAAAVVLAVAVNVFDTCSPRDNVAVGGGIPYKPELPNPSQPNVYVATERHSIKYLQRIDELATSGKYQSL